MQIAQTGAYNFSKENQGEDINLIFVKSDGSRFATSSMKIVTMCNCSVPCACAEDTKSVEQVGTTSTKANEQVGTASTSSATPHTGVSQDTAA